MSAQVEEVSASAQSLAEMAQTLQQLVAQFRISSERPSAQEKSSIQKHMQEPILLQTNVAYATHANNGHSSVKALP
jgi:hypothetical protein